MLTQATVKGLKPKEKRYKKADSGGLTLIVNPNGKKVWNLRYRFEKKEHTFNIGIWPDISLEVARHERENIKALVRKGINPNKKEQATNDTFQTVAEEWIEKQTNGWSENHKKDVISKLTKHVYPTLGKVVMSEITATEILNIIEQMEARGLGETVRKVLQKCGSIFGYGILTKRCIYDPTQRLDKTLTKLAPAKNRPALTKEELPLFFKKLDNYRGELQNILAIKLMFYTLARPGNIGEAEWSEFDNSTWTIQGKKMKRKVTHKVYLPPQAIAIVEQLRVFNSHSQYLFPNRSNANKFISENTLTQIIHRLGFDACAHGTRSTGSSLLNEMGFNPDAIEAQLSHIDADAVRRAYNRTTYWDERKKMMTVWADYLDGLNGGEA